MGSEMCIRDRDLLDAKTKALQSAERVEELYENALNAFRGYSGQGGGDDIDTDIF